jgi:hypothetical protein
VSKVLIKLAGLNIFPTLVQASKTYQSIEDTKGASSSDFFVFLCGSFIFAVAFYFSFFVEIAAKSEYNSIKPIKKYLTSLIQILC